MSYEQQAFFTVCDQAVPAASHYVSLYRIETWYGGPQEGGWWGHDETLVASQKFDTYEAAVAAKEAVTALAAQMTEDARNSFNAGCAAQVEWLEARGLDDNYLPEVGGADRYSVVIEDRAGENAYCGSREWS